MRHYKYLLSVAFMQHTDYRVKITVNVLIRHKSVGAFVIGPARASLVVKYPVVKLLCIPRYFPSHKRFRKSRTSMDIQYHRLFKIRLIFYKKMSGSVYINIFRLFH